VNDGGETANAAYQTRRTESHHPTAASAPRTTTGTTTTLSDTDFATPIEDRYFED
jgi:hypothetical protein